MKAWRSASPTPSKWRAMRSLWCAGCGECRSSRPATDDECEELPADWMHAFGEGDAPAAR